jgi:hypothetical protein
VNPSPSADVSADPAAAVAASGTGKHWNDIPFQPIKRTGQIIGGSPSKVYDLLNKGELDAVRLGGKTLITTPSLERYLAKASPWTSNRDRVKAAIKARLKNMGMPQSRAERASQARHHNNSVPRSVRPRTATPPR